MRVFLAGGTGLVGSRLIRKLTERGDEVVVLTRNAAAASAKLRLDKGTPIIVEGDPTQTGQWMDHVVGCEAVVNLTGEGIFNRRWSDDFKKTLYDSRVRSTENIVEAIRRQGDGKTGRRGETSTVSSPRPPVSESPRPSLLVNASAIGYYGFHEDEELNEESGPGDDFLARLCVDWEAAAKKAEALGVRTVMLRTGVVLDPLGGALKKMMLPFKLFVGGKVGSGRQWVSWVHHADEVGVILFALDNAEVRGPINSTAPHPVTNKELSKALGAALHRPSIFPTPAAMLRLSLGGVAEIITQGQKVLPRKAQQLGFNFRYPEINAALGEIFAR